MPWDPESYRRHLDDRLRPGLDLLARVDLASPDLAVDLGCGTGELTRHLAGVWPGARVIGLDSSPEMLSRARSSGSRIEWVEGRIERWEPPRPPSLVFSNAALHWVDDHAALFPRLAGLLAPGGVLAVQMPANHHAASHRVIAAAAKDGPWSERLGPLVRESPVAAPEWYHRLLSPVAGRVDVWATEYLHRLRGPDPVFEWVSGSVLRPLLDALDPPDRRELAGRVRDDLAAAYPPEPDGTVLFPFRRLFVVARASG